MEYRLFGFQKQTKECLIMLLYCFTNLSTGGSLANMDFALSRAVNLAEAGQTVQNRRTGNFLFCSTLIFISRICPRIHVLYRNDAQGSRTPIDAGEYFAQSTFASLNIVIQGTTRLYNQDLESSAIARICLALEVLVQSPSEDIIPAVQDRLYELLVHNSSVCILISNFTLKIEIFLLRLDPMFEDELFTRFKLCRHFIVTSLSVSWTSSISDFGILNLPWLSLHSR